MKSNFKLYYIFGCIVTLISILVFVIFLTLPLCIIDFPEILGWISIVICMISFVGIIFGIYLLKKANFLKLNSKQSLAETKIKEKIKEEYEKYNKLDGNDNY